MKKSLHATYFVVPLGAIAPSAAQQTRLDFFTGNDQAVVAYSEALATAFEATHPNVDVVVEVGLGGSERDNMVKSRLVTGTLSDVFVYNAGSLFQALNPTKSLLDLSGEPWQADILDSFKQTVSGTDRSVRGAPFGMAMGGGFLYNKKVCAELGLQVPKTWDAFMANNAKIKEAGKVPFIQTFGSTWTSQLFVLADYYNVQAAVPNFAQDYTAGTAKYANTPAAMGGFRHLADVFAAGDLNEDFAAATFEDGLMMLAEGQGAHYPMLTFALGTISQTYPELVNDIGFFGIPGPDAEKNGTTIWMPTAIYISADTKNPEIAKEFVAFRREQGRWLRPSGAERTRDRSISDQGLRTAGRCASCRRRHASILRHRWGNSSRTGVRLACQGPNLESLTIEVGSGIRSPESAAELYDEDVRKQAQQLGLPGWQ